MVLHITEPLSPSASQFLEPKQIKKIQKIKDFLQFEPKMTPITPTKIIPKMFKAFQLSPRNSSILTCVFLIFFLLLSLSSIAMADVAADVIESSSSFASSPSQPSISPPISISSINNDNYDEAYLSPISLSDGEDSIFLQGKIKITKESSRRFNRNPLIPDTLTLSSTTRLSNIDTIIINAYCKFFDEKKQIFIYFRCINQSIDAYWSLNHPIYLEFDNYTLSQMANTFEVYFMIRVLLVDYILLYPLEVQMSLVYSFQGVDSLAPSVATAVTRHYFESFHSIYWHSPCLDVVCQETSGLTVIVDGWASPPKDDDKEARQRYALRLKISDKASFEFKSDGSSDGEKIQNNGQNDQNLKQNFQKNFRQENGGEEENYFFPSSSSLSFSNLPNSLSPSFFEQNPLNSTICIVDFYKVRVITLEKEPPFHNIFIILEDIFTSDNSFPTFELETLGIVCDKISIKFLEDTPKDYFLTIESGILERPENWIDLPEWDLWNRLRWIPRSSYTDLWSFKNYIPPAQLKFKPSGYASDGSTSVRGFIDLKTMPNRNDRLLICGIEEASSVSFTIHQLIKNENEIKVWKSYTAFDHQNEVETSRAYRDPFDPAWTDKDLEELLQKLDPDDDDSHHNGRIVMNNIENKDNNNKKQKNQNSEKNQKNQNSENENFSLFDTFSNFFSTLFDSSFSTPSVISQDTSLSIGQVQVTPISYKPPSLRALQNTHENNNEDENFIENENDENENDENKNNEKFVSKKQQNKFYRYQAQRQIYYKEKRFEDVILTNPITDYKIAQQIKADWAQAIPKDILLEELKKEEEEKKQKYRDEEAILLEELKEEKKKYPKEDEEKKKGINEGDKEQILGRIGSSHRKSPMFFTTDGDKTIIHPIFNQQNGQNGLQNSQKNLQKNIFSTTAASTSSTRASTATTVSDESSNFISPPRTGGFKTLATPLEDRICVQLHPFKALERLSTGIYWFVGSYKLAENGDRFGPNSIIEEEGNVEQKGNEEQEGNVGDGDRFETNSVVIEDLLPNDSSDRSNINTLLENSLPNDTSNQSDTDALFQNDNLQSHINPTNNKSHTTFLPTQERDSNGYMNLLYQLIGSNQHVGIGLYNWKFSGNFFINKGSSIFRNPPKYILFSPPLPPPESLVQLMLSYIVPSSWSLSTGSNYSSFESSQSSQPSILPSQLSQPSQSKSSLLSSQPSLLQSQPSSQPSLYERFALRYPYHASLGEIYFQVTSQNWWKDTPSSYSSIILHVYGYHLTTTPQFLMGGEKEKIQKVNEEKKIQNINDQIDDTDQKNEEEEASTLTTSKSTSTHGTKSSTSATSAPTPSIDQNYFSDPLFFQGKVIPITDCTIRSGTYKEYHPEDLTLIHNVVVEQFDTYFRFTFPKNVPLLLDPLGRNPTSTIYDGIYISCPSIYLISEGQHMFKRKSTAALHFYKKTEIENFTQKNNDENFHSEEINKNFRIFDNNNNNNNFEDNGTMATMSIHNSTTSITSLSLSSSSISSSAPSSSSSSSPLSFTPTQPSPSSSSSSSLTQPLSPLISASHWTITYDLTSIVDADQSPEQNLKLYQTWFEKYFSSSNFFLLPLTISLVSFIVLIIILISFGCLRTRCFRRYFICICPCLRRLFWSNKDFDTFQDEDDDNYSNNGGGNGGGDYFNRNRSLNQSNDNNDGINNNNYDDNDGIYHKSISSSSAALERHELEVTNLEIQRYNAHLKDQNQNQSLICPLHIRHQINTNPNNPNNIFDSQLQLQQQQQYNYNDPKGSYNKFMGGESYNPPPQPRFPLLNSSHGGFNREDTLFSGSSSGGSDNGIGMGNQVYNSEIHRQKEKNDQISSIQLQNGHNNNQNNNSLDGHIGLTASTADLTVVGTSHGIDFTPNIQNHYGSPKISSSMTDGGNGGIKGGQKNNFNQNNQQNNNNNNGQDYGQLYYSTANLTTSTTNTVSLSISTANTTGSPNFKSPTTTITSTPSVHGGGGSIQTPLMVNKGKITHGAAGKQQTSTNITGGSTTQLNTGAGGKKIKSNYGDFF